MRAVRLRIDARDVVLQEGDFTIGRADACQIRVDDPLVSRRHTTLHVSSDEVTITDLGARNGVIVNGQRLDACSTATLAIGDRLLIGRTELTLLEPRAKRQAN